MFLLYTNAFGTTKKPVIDGYAVLKYGNGVAPFGFEHWAIQDDGDGILDLYGIGNPYNGDSGHALYGLGATIDLGEN